MCEEYPLRPDPIDEEEEKHWAKVFKKLEEGEKKKGLTAETYRFICTHCLKSEGWDK